MQRLINYFPAINELHAHAHELRISQGVLCTLQSLAPQPQGVPAIVGGAVATWDNCVQARGLSKIQLQFALCVGCQ